MKLKYRLGDRVLYRENSPGEQPTEYLGKIVAIILRGTELVCTTQYSIETAGEVRQAMEDEILGRVEIIKEQPTPPRSSKKRGRPKKYSDRKDHSSTQTNGTGSGIDYQKAEVVSQASPPNDLL